MRPPARAQRAGRAARQQPGIAYRLWEEAATSGLMPFDPPEILEADLSPLLLDCLIWGVRDPQGLSWLDTPPAPAVAEAWTRLRGWGAVDAEDRPTPHGRAMARLPLPPRLAHMLLKAAEAGADVCTCPLDSILGLLKHPLTDIGLAKFLEDAKKM